MTTLRLTDAGRTAVADGANRAVRNIQIRALVIGDGIGPGGADDDGRTALRSQVDRAVVSGTTAVEGRLAVRADFAPTTGYSVTEVGIIARIGDGGSEFLLAYWATPNAGMALAVAAPKVTMVIVAVVDVLHEAGSAARVPVTVDETVAIVGGPDSLLGLVDGPDAFLAGKYFRANAAGTAGLWDEAPPVVGTETGLPAAATSPQSVFLVQDYASTGYPVLALRDGGDWRYCWSKPVFAENSTTETGLVELATNAEHTTAVPPSDRAATPAGAREQIARMLAAANLVRTTRYVTAFDVERTTQRSTSYATNVDTTRATQRSTQRATNVDTTRATQRRTRYYVYDGRDAPETTIGGHPRRSRYRNTAVSTAVRVRRQTRFDTAVSTAARVERQTAHDTAVATTARVERQTAHDTSRDTRRATLHDTMRDTHRLTLNE